MLRERHNLSLSWGCADRVPHNSSRMFYRTHVAHNSLCARRHLDRALATLDEVPARRARFIEHLCIAVLPHGIRNGGLDPTIPPYFSGALRGGMDPLLCKRHRVSPPVREEKETSLAAFSHACPRPIQYAKNLEEFIVRQVLLLLSLLHLCMPLLVRRPSPSLHNRFR